MLSLKRMVPQLVWLVWLVSVGCSDDPVEQTSTKMTPMMPMAGTPSLSRPETQPSSAGQPSDSNQGGSTTPSSPPPPMPPTTGGSVQMEPGGMIAPGGQRSMAGGMTPQMGGAPAGGMALQAPEPTPVERFTRRRIDLPFIYDFSGAPQAHVDGLIRRAIDGLGFEDGTGPTPLDRVFVNRHFIAWIDETGFYGKMNGLWPLNSDPNALEFVMLEGNRPVNALVVGERGNGLWPAGYMGAEHIEFPNNTPEDDDDPNCRNSFCAQYAHGEAHRFSIDAIPAWRTCNDGSPNFGDRFLPTLDQVTDDGLRLVYRGPLTKQGDFGGSTSGNHCHEDFLFPDGERRRVILETGYIFGAESRFIDRTMQVENTAGNPPFTGPYAFIGGFVLTSWPNPHPLKALSRFVRPVLRDLTIDWPEQNPVEAPAGQWTRLPSEAASSDVVVGQAGQPITLSPVAAQLFGQAFTIENVGPQDNQDTGFCLCSVHGGLEMGGGLIPQPSIPGGERSAVGIRRLTIHHEDVPPAPPQDYVYEAETDLLHEIGYADDDGWAANTAAQMRGHLVYGPYARDWGDGERTASFRMMLDVVGDRPEIVARIDIFDADTQEVVAERDVLRSDFQEPFTYVDITLEFDLNSRRGHAMETRVWWTDISYVRVDRVAIE